MHDDPRELLRFGAAKLPFARARVGCGIALGSANVAGFVSSSDSAHQWSVFGDAASEAAALAAQRPARVRMTSAAAKIFESSRAWSAVFMRQAIDFDTASKALPPEQRNETRNRFVQQLRDAADDIKQAIERVKAECDKESMPPSASADGSTVLSTYQLVFPNVPQLIKRRVSSRRIGGALVTNSATQPGSATAKVLLAGVMDGSSYSEGGEGGESVVTEIPDLRRMPTDPRADAAAAVATGAGPGRGAATDDT